MDIQTAIQHVLDRKNLEPEQMQQVMRSIMTGACTPAQIAGFLIGLRMKGETVDEITAAAQIMRALSTRVQVTSEYLVDTCGTGGDGANTFNISTAAAFVAAAAGARVAKHGNRSVSSKSGSADVLEAAGIRLELTSEQVALCINQIGIGFMFAPLHHEAMKHAIGTRRELGVRTIFNLLGPLTNPAGAPNQVLGVFSKDWLETLAQVQKNLGASHVMVVHAEDGLDEISIAAPTLVADLVNGTIKQYTITPGQFKIESTTIDSIVINSAEESLHMMMSVLDNTPGPAKDIVVLNAGAAIYTAGVTDNLAAGVKKAATAIADGTARGKFDQLVQLTNAF
jgi:anthranilate phosphoribosyltransferase